MYTQHTVYATQLLLIYDVLMTKRVRVSSRIQQTPATMIYSSTRFPECFSVDLLAIIWVTNKTRAVKEQAAWVTHMYTLQYILTQMKKTCVIGVCHNLTFAGYMGKTCSKITSPHAKIRNQRKLRNVHIVPQAARSRIATSFIYCTCVMLSIVAEATASAIVYSNKAGRKSHPCGKCLMLKHQLLWIIM